ncbi:sensor domain-containing diguanylate cyclase [Litoribacillus peritrichatus]|uniref:diguanylate cyclase n=1 Tax=Litoribacillus peritrichatus TaxID=718191 RepID=A0ABP7MSY0_9GAMM
MNESVWINESEDHQTMLKHWQEVVDVMAEVCRAPAGFIVQYTDKGFMAIVASSNVQNPYQAGMVIEEDVNIFCRKVIHSNRSLYVPDASQDPVWADNPEVLDGFVSYLGYPIFWPNGKPFGSICVMDYKVTHYDSMYRRLVTQFRNMVEANLALVEQNESLREIAITDELTGLYNRRGFNFLAQRQLKMATRMHQRLGLLYLDVDDLKTINDNIGHDAGDEAIIRLAECLSHCLRESDTSARLGGDEFSALVLLGEDNTLKPLIHRLEDYISKQQLSFGRQLSVSIGGVVVDEEGLDVKNLVEKADQEMYRVKRQRKNHVTH